MKSTSPAGIELQEMFGAVPCSYDRLNRLLTFGLDRSWRRLAARACLEDSPRRVLDLGSGTGDLALELARLSAPGMEITAVDFSAPMLEIARRKAGRLGLDERISFVPADAAELPFPDGHFDAVGLAFSFRNLTYSNPVREQHLRELRRVCAPGGRLVIVETSQPDSVLWRYAVHGYLRAMAAPLGGLLSGQPAAYRYLARSACGFHDRRQVVKLLQGAGFSALRTRPLLGGVACLHVVGAAAAGERT